MKNAPKSGANKSGCYPHKSYQKVLGGVPEKKSVAEVDKCNRPSGRKRAPGAYPAAR